MPAIAPRALFPAVCLLILWAAPAFANEIHVVHFVNDADGSVTFGPGGAHGDQDVNGGVSVDGVDRDDVDLRDLGCDQDCRFQFELNSPIDSTPFDEFHYGDGTFRIIANVFSPGPPLFEAEIDDAVIDIIGPDLDPDQFFGEVRLTLGPGQFSPELAHLLGLPRVTLDGAFVMFIDMVDMDPDGLGGHGGGNHGDGLDVTVPEPGSFSLVAAGLLGLARRRRRC